MGSGIYAELDSRIVAKNATFIGQGSAPGILMENNSTKVNMECVNLTVRSSGTYAVINNNVQGGHCIIRSRASNFGITGGIKGYVMATTNASTGQSSELVRFYNASTTYVIFPIWTEKDGQDDIKWYNTTKSSNYNEVRIYKSNHNNETGGYCVHIYDAVTSGVTRNIVGQLMIYL